MSDITEWPNNGIIVVKESQIQAVTVSLQRSQLILHPVISPRGCPDFSGRFGRKNIVILDRNIVTRMVQFCRTGELPNERLRRILAALLIWADINGIALTGGLALNEYAANSDGMLASSENRDFRQIFDEYPTLMWLDVFEGKRNCIPKMTSATGGYGHFDVENKHYLMHLAGVIHLTRLCMDDRLDPHERLVEYLTWVDKHQFFCAYTVIYACMLFTRRVTQPRLKSDYSYESRLRDCSNQAWDLAYLSFWSTLYWSEHETETNHLFATFDKGLKRVFMETHDTSNDVFVRFFGKSKGAIILRHYDEIKRRRVMPVIPDENMHATLEREKSSLAIECRLRPERGYAR